MVDHLNPKQRSANMARIRSKNTALELVVRQALHRMGLRFRLHRKDLPGSPDIVFPKFRAVVFVHGCFWHRHKGCRLASEPSTRSEFWAKKFAANVSRDEQTMLRLAAQGWRVGVIWQCAVKSPGPTEIAHQINAWLNGASGSLVIPSD